MMHLHGDSQGIAGFRTGSPKGQGQIEKEWAETLSRANNSLTSKQGLPTHSGFLLTINTVSIATRPSSNDPPELQSLWNTGIQ